MNTEKKRRELKVDKEDDNSEVDKSVRCRDPVGFFVQHEDDGGNEWGFCVAKIEIFSLISFNLNFWK